MQTHHSLTRALPRPLRNPAHSVWTFVQDIIRCDLIKQASAMAYVTLLSLVPSLVAVFCVLSLFAPLMGDGVSLIDEAREFLLDNLASDSGENVVRYLDNMLSHLNLASIGWSSFASVLITLVLLLRQIEEALNRIWLVNKGRNVFMRFMYFWTFLTLGMVVVAVAVGVSSGFRLPDFMTETVNSPAVSGFGWLTSWIVGLVGGFIFFFFLYKIVPNCYVGTKNAAIGAAVASVILHVGGRLYGLYVRDAKNYTTIYGAMAQLPLFLTWLYICWIIILVGALISWRLQEGFPKLAEETTLDRAKSSLDHLRNAQVKAVLPLISMLAIYKQFDTGTGKGLSGQALAHALKMPVSWVSEAIDALQELGYVIASKQDSKVASAQVTDPFFPAMPAQSLPMAKVSKDLASPMEQWLIQWNHELPLDLRQALQFLAVSNGNLSTMAEVLAKF